MAEWTSNINRLIVPGSLRNNKILKVILSLIALIILKSATVSALTANPVTVDSLFVIASSGELRFRDMVQPAIDSLAAMGTAAVPRLIDKLNTKSARERLTLINIFKKIGKIAVPQLTDALQRPEGLVVERVCMALGEIGDSSATLALKGMITHPRWQVRDESLGALGKIGDLRAHPSITIGFADSVGQVRKSAAVAAGKTTHTDALPKLVNQLADSFYGARFMAAEALLKLDTVAVTKILADSISSNRTLVGNLACEILGRLKTTEAIAILKAHSKSSNPTRRTHAARSLFLAGDSASVSVILTAEADSLAALQVRSLMR